VGEPLYTQTKEVSKLSVLEDILRPDLSPELYGELYHKIRINYYPPHGDNKESWDNIDIFGWLGYSMQIKINFLCKDSILAAPWCWIWPCSPTSPRGRYERYPGLAFLLF